MSDFVKVLEDELAALELAMANDPKAVEARMIRELLAKHGSWVVKEPSEAVACSTKSTVISARIVQDVAEPIRSSSPTVSAKEAKDILAKLSHNSSRPAEQDTKNPAPVVRDGKGAHMKHEIAQLISERGAPVHRTDILKHLTRKKMIGNKPNQLAYISSYLSRWSRDFVSDGHGNFSLRNGRLSGPPRAPSERHSIGAAG